MVFLLNVSAEVEKNASPSKKPLQELNGSESATRRYNSAAF